MDNLHEKFTKLIDLLRSYNHAAIAFSGGVDSTFLLYAAKEALGNKVLAVTASSLSFPQRELLEAKTYATQNGIEHIIVASEELDIKIVLQKKYSLTIDLTIQLMSTY